MSNYLSLVQSSYRELRLSGTAPTTVVSQTSQRRDVCECVAEAIYQIETRWDDWNFMWAQHSDSTVAGTTDYSAPSDLARYDLESFYLDYTSDNNSHLKYVPYKYYRDNYLPGTQTNAYSDYFTTKPDHSIVLWPPPNAVYALTADYWKEPTKPTVDASTHNIPVRYERIISALAKMMFGERFGDNGAYMSGKIEYEEMLKRLEANELPDRPENMSQADLVIVSQ